MVWIQHLMGELGYIVKTLNVVYCDKKCNASCRESCFMRQDDVKLHPHCLRKLVSNNNIKNKNSHQFH